MPGDHDDWSPEQIEQAKDVFRSEDVRGRPGRRLVARLWGNWRTAGLGESYFDDPEQDMALALHARAHGLAGSDDWERVSGLLSAHHEWYDPSVPPPLSLGPRANLSPELGSALDSQVMDAWIMRAGSAPVKVLIIGSGVPQISEAVSADAFMLSLRSGTSASDLITAGVIRVDLGSAQDPVPLPVNPLGSDPSYQPAVVTAGEAMDDFVTSLIDLATRTGLIRVHEVDDADQRDLLRHLRGLAERDEDTPAGVWALASERAAAPRVAALFPYLRIPGGNALSLRLSRDLLANPAYKNLAEVYLGGMLGRIIGDTEGR